MGPFSKFFKQTDVMLGAGLLGIVGMLILPVPHWLLDVGFVFAIAISVVILLTCVNITDPLQFNIFPSLLLITTLFRLSLSVAATKLILGTGNGGKVIETFGQFVMKGDFVVGFVAFLILVIVQFVVITNGAGRVSEVAARFTLDAMPGRQMAIDADLAAGLINEQMAKERRKAVKMEADFYGAMDGASKFVKGDAIAAILIIVVNIIGGFLVGFMKGEGDALDILRNYSLLSVGEGLVSQISALLISTSSGLLVTRAGQENTMSSNIIKQLFDQPRAIQFSGVALVGFGLVPGFPTLLFFTVGGALIYLSRVLFQEQQLLPIPVEPTLDNNNQESEIPPYSPEAALPFVSIDPLEIEVGYGLTHLADNNAGGDLSERIIMARKQIALEIGYIMPSVRVRDSIHLQPHEYAIRIRGEEIARSELQPNMLMALEGDHIIERVHGAFTTDPVFGIQAVWIEPALKSFAEQNGYTVIEPTAIISTHLGEIVKKHASELLGRQEVQALIDNLKKTSPAVIEELIPNIMQLGEVQKILQHLLKENIPIKDLNTILEVLADYGTRYKEADQLGELVRSAISRTIVRQYMQGDTAAKLYCITFDGTLERALTDQIQQVGVSNQIILDPEVQRKLVAQINKVLEQSKARGENPILLCSSTLRLPLRRLLDRNNISSPVLAYNEVTSSTNVDFIGTINVI